MQYKFTFILLITLITGAYSQQSSNPLIDQGSEVLIDRLPENDFFYTHVFQKGQTVYSLARTFKTSVREIYALNNLSANSPIDIGQTVKVPFSISSLYTEASSTASTSNKYVPVYYVVQPKETLYGIGKTYFNQDVATFAKRNKIKGTAISIGQKLLIGWLPLNGEGPIVRVNTTLVKSDLAVKTNKTETAIENEIAQKIKRSQHKEEAEIAQKSENVDVAKKISEVEKKETIDDIKQTIIASKFTSKPQREKFVTTIVTPESIKDNKDKVHVPNPNDIKEEIEMASEEIPDTLATKIELPEKKAAPLTKTRQTRGIGIWERDSKVSSMSFVLHHTAKKGSTIELYNPQLNRRTTAKVLGRIPLGTYPSDVSVIMSKKVAESLGALDTRIMVELKFIEDLR